MTGNIQIVISHVLWRCHKCFCYASDIFVFSPSHPTPTPTPPQQLPEAAKENAFKMPENLEHTLPFAERNFPGNRVIFRPRVLTENPPARISRCPRVAWPPCSSRSVEWRSGERRCVWSRQEPGDRTWGISPCHWAPERWRRGIPNTGMG